MNRPLNQTNNVTCQCLVRIANQDQPRLIHVTKGFSQLYAQEQDAQGKLTWDMCFRVLPSLTDQRLLLNVVEGKIQKCLLKAPHEQGMWLVFGETLDHETCLLTWHRHDQDSYVQIVSPPSEQHLLEHQVLNALPTPIFMKNREHRWVMGNKAFFELLAIEDESDMIGRSDYDFFPKEQADHFWEMDEKVFLSGHPLTVEEPITNHAGVQKWLMTQKIPVTLSSGEEVLIGIISDITKRKLIEQQRELNQEAMTRVERAKKSKNKFLTNMSHELRTPLNAVIGYTELISDDLEDLSPEEMQGDLHKISSAAHHLLDLVNSILDISKAEQGRVIVRYERVNVSDVVRQVSGFCQALLNDSPCTLHVTLPEEDLWVDSEASKLHQITLNLLSNAVKFTSKGRIDVQVKVDEEDFILCVKDTGPGIPMEQWHHIFEPFERLDEHKSIVEGTGLGLSLTRHLCQVMGGDISLDSTLGEGSSFTVRLPLCKDEEVTQESQVAPSQNSSSFKARQLNLPAVLIIDDDPHVSELITRFSASQPVDVFWTLDAARGCELASQHLPELIVLDLNMPVMDGWEVFEQLRADPRTRDIPIVIISFMDVDGYESQEQLEVHRLQKPISRTQWNALFEQYLKRSTPQMKPHTS